MPSPQITFILPVQCNSYTGRYGQWVYVFGKNLACDGSSTLKFNGSPDVTLTYSSEDRIPYGSFLLYSYGDGTEQLGFPVTNEMAGSGTLTFTNVDGTTTSTQQLDVSDTAVTGLPTIDRWQLHPTTVTPGGGNWCYLFGSNFASGETITSVDFDGFDDMVRLDSTVREYSPNQLGFSTTQYAGYTLNPLPVRVNTTGGSVTFRDYVANFPTNGLVSDWDASTYISYRPATQPRYWRNLKYVVNNILNAGSMIFNTAPTVGSGSQTARTVQLVGNYAKGSDTPSVTTYSVSAWVRFPNSIPTGSDPVLVFGNIPSTVGASNFYQIDFDKATGTFRGGHTQFGGADKFATIQSSPSSGQWYNLVVTYDGTTIRTYSNGSAVTTLAASVSNSSWNESMVNAFVDSYALGLTDPSTMGCMDIEIGQIQLWDRALISDEITKIYNYDYAKYALI